MSMISAQADELRELAGDGSMEWVAGPIRASVLREAADMLDEHAKLREQTELLVTLLRNDCDIEASWDGLRKFWYIGLTESGCLMRDRACKAEAENAKLRERLSQRTAKRIVVSNHDTDCATGHAECSECGGAIDFWDGWCRHCGARLEDE